MLTSGMLIRRNFPTTPEASGKCAHSCMLLQIYLSSEFLHTIHRYTILYVCTYVCSKHTLVCIQKHSEENPPPPVIPHPPTILFPYAQIQHLVHKEIRNEKTCTSTCSRKNVSTQAIRTTRFPPLSQA